MGIKVSNAMDKALGQLKTFAAEQLKNPEPQIAVKLTTEQFTELTTGYETTLNDGTVRGVSAGDYEAIGNFERDMHTAVKALGGEVGHPFLEKNEDQDSFKLSLEFPEVAGHGRIITGAFFRPGKEETVSQDYSAVTRTWAATEDDKAVDDYLAGLSKKLLKGKK